MRRKEPYSDEGNFWTRLVKHHNWGFSDYYNNQTMGCLLQLIFLCFYGFLIYLFITLAIAWAKQPGDTLITPEEWYETFDVKDEFNLEVVDVFECFSDERLVGGDYKYPGFVGIDRKNRQILHTYHTGMMEINSTYKTDFNISESNITASKILKIRSAGEKIKYVMNFNTLTGHADIDKFDLNNNGGRVKTGYHEKWNCGTGKLKTSNKTIDRDA